MKKCNGLSKDKCKGDCEFHMEAHDKLNPEDAPGVPSKPGPKCKVAHPLFEKVMCSDPWQKLLNEVKACKEAAALALKELNKVKKEAEEAAMKAAEDDTMLKRCRQYERRLEEVTNDCAHMIKRKDLELGEKNSIIQRLQRKLADDSKRFQDFADVWDSRVQVKEKGYNKAIAELAFAEGQIVEERKRTQIQIEKVKARDRDIARLKAEHSEELRVREKYRMELEEIVRAMEQEVEDQDTRFMGIRERLELELDQVRHRSEDKVFDLRIEMARRDRLREEVETKLKEVQEQLFQARQNWEEKERELEVYIRSRDRTILALRNELEFLNDNWEIKYARLVNLYEKLQKKHEETVGPNGINEAYRRAMAVKEENETLHKKIHELQDVIQKQKAAIRGLQLDIDQLMKETADVIAEKERGIAEMAGDYTRLENKWRDEQTLRTRLLKQKDAERLALAESFTARVEQLEQIMEAMRFNDRQEMLDKIRLWKKNYERVCCERDEVEEYYKDLVDVKEKQLLKMLNENDEERERTAKAHEHGEYKMKEVEQTWKKKHMVLIEAKDELEQRHRDLQVENDKNRILKDRALGIAAVEKVEDPAMQKLRDEIEELKKNIVAVEEGKQAIIEENSKLLVQEEAKSVEYQDLHAVYQPQLKAKDKQIEKMEQAHEELKEILKLEMKRAQDTCKDIEEQVKRFPDPFIDEIQEMKDKYNQMQAGMQKIQFENLKLREDNEKAQAHLHKEINSLEKTLGLAKTLLHEVSTLEALKHLQHGEAHGAEELLGLA